MSSILTNYGAMVALQNLQATQRSLTETQNHISSGLKVATARDDASAWTIASTMKSNVASLNQVSQNLGNADSILGTAVSGATQISKLVSSIRAKVATFSFDSALTNRATADAAQPVTLARTSASHIDLPTSGAPGAKSGNCVGGLVIGALRHGLSIGETPWGLAGLGPTVRRRPERRDPGVLRRRVRRSAGQLRRR